MIEAVGGVTFNKILKVVRDTTGMDFTYYKHATVRRRIARRMALQSIKREEAYVRYLAKHREEVEALSEDILIHVTEFFRDVH
jgi:two-component system CheB/CheR fusion protein